MTEHAPEPGQPEEVAPGVNRILAPNPSPMTHWGTNSYILGERELAIIDPGPDDPGHLDALLATAGGRPVTAVLVTHAHRDHSAGARMIAARTGAPVYAFGEATAGRSARMSALEDHPGLGGGEGLDRGFTPDRVLGDGARITVDGQEIEVLHTPGHFAGHLSFSGLGYLFSGDLVMGWSTTLISPPDGDIAAFMASCRRLRARKEAIYFPGHGAPVTAAHDRLDWLIAHRLDREGQIREALRAGPATAKDLAARIYTDIPTHFLAAAARNVLAHLIDLADRGLATTDAPPGPDARFTGV